MKLALGIDPGIESTGWALIKRTPTGAFKHIESGVSRAKPSMRFAVRLEQHWFCVSEILALHPVDMVAIESIFFNKNVSSCLSTASVIAVIELRAQLLEIETVQVKPQTVKKAVAAPTAKASVLKMVNRILKTRITNHHQGDACAVAMAGLLRNSVKNMESKRC